MRLQDITGKDLITQDLGATLRTDALRELLAPVARRKGFTALQTTSFLAQVLQRHDRIPSGLGRGLAFPNARVADLGEPTLSIGLSRRGIDFQARDGAPVHVIFLYLGRSNPPEEERRMLSRLSAALADPGTAEVLLAASTVAEVWEAILVIDSKEKVGARSGGVA